MTKAVRVFMVMPLAALVLAAATPVLAIRSDSDPAGDASGYAMQSTPSPQTPVQATPTPSTIYPEGWPPVVCAEVIWEGSTEDVRGLASRQGVVQGLTPTVAVDQPLKRWEDLGVFERGPVVTVSWEISASDVLCVQVLKKSPAPPGAAWWEGEGFDDGNKLNLPTETTFTDDGGFYMPGRYCYRIVPIGEKGPLEFAETCVDVPTVSPLSIVNVGGPPASNQPSTEPITGSGGRPSGGDFPWWTLALAAVPVAALGGFLALRRRGA